MGVGAGPAHVQPMNSQGPASVADLAQRLIGSVVNISTSQTITGDDNGGEDDQGGQGGDDQGGDDRGGVPMPKLPQGSPFQDFFNDFFNHKNSQGQPDTSRKVESLGSGFVVDAKEGIIVTNNHVIAGADDIEVNFQDGVRLKATLLGKDTKTDLAVLKVDPTKHKMTAVKFGDSDKMRIGDWVMAIGNPFGLGGTVTLGIVSAVNRDINSGPYDDYIQTDAAINRGNSGGPLFNMAGEVIGINTAIISPSGGSIGIGFSIPSKLASEVVEQLSKYGETRRAWLGVRIQQVTDDIADSLGMGQARGALVAGIVKGGPVDNGSIEPGDVIVKFDGQDVKEMRDLPRIVAEDDVGKTVDVVVVRKGKEQTVKVKLGRLQDQDEQAGKTPSKSQQHPSAKPSEGLVLGMTLGELNQENRGKFKIAPDVKGVIVTQVVPDSPAAEKGIAVGEVITEISQQAVSTPKDVRDRIAALRQQNRRAALLMLSSKTGELRFVTVRIDG
ncbi:MAG: Do family serine endopeptidase [Rhizobiaceae bacterium]|nr:MAG: Do family serine endopeptidase [Rhizobiaceae bacterium]